MLGGKTADEDEEEVSLEVIGLLDAEVEDDAEELEEIFVFLHAAKAPSMARVRIIVCFFMIFPFY